MLSSLNHLKPKSYFRLAFTSQALKWNLCNGHFSYGQFLMETIMPDKNGQGTSPYPMPQVYAYLLSCCFSEFGLPWEEVQFVIQRRVDSNGMSA